MPRGTTLLEAAALAHVRIGGDCGGNGTCGQCKVKIVEGKKESPTAAELDYLSAGELSSGWVLACQRSVEQDTVVEVETGGADHRKVTLEEINSAITFDPPLEKISLTLSSPSLEDQRADWDRLLEHLPQKKINARLRVLTALPRTLRENDFSVAAILAGNRLIDVKPGDGTQHIYGLAFDLGTTTIAGSLLDLSTGSVTAVSADTNPQSVYGADVISRINHVRKSRNGLNELHQKVIDAVNGITLELLSRAGVNRSDIYEMSVVGNTTMSHLFLGVDPSNLAVPPFIAGYRHPVEIEASELGLIMNPGGRVTVLPNIAGYIGSDSVAVILATRLDQYRDNCLALDMGTNGELILAARGRMYACSTAAGPAFEGARIKHGMRAAHGAIETVHTGEDIHIEVIGNTPPRGICGSGLFDLAAGLLKSGVVELSGRFVDPEKNDGSVPPRLKERLRRGEKGLEFVVVPAELSATGEDIVLTQTDVRQLQLAKGAIYAGVKILLKEAAIEEDDISEVFLAGAFGNYIQKESALATGLLPALPPQRITPVGNAAGSGARMVLLSREMRSLAFALPDRVKHIELFSRTDYQQEFIKALAFPDIKK